MRYILFFLVAILFAYNAHGQTTRVIHGDTVIVNKTGGETTTLTNKQTGIVETFTYVEQMPQAPYDVNAYLAKNMRYPEDAIEDGITGKVIVLFKVDVAGAIDSVRVLRPTHPSLEKEVIRVVKSMPAWRPAMYKGKPVQSPYTLPIHITPNR